MSSQPNNEIVPDSNPASPSSPAPEFIVEIPLDDNFIYPDQDDDIPLPEPNNTQEVYSLQNDLSESDLSSYSLNYESDIIDGENDPIPVYPTIPLTNYPQDRDDPEDQANWIKLEEDDIWSVPPLPLL